MNQNNLKKKTLTGLFWSFSDLIVNQGLKFVVQIVLARLLLPADFGTIGIITVFVAVSQSIIDSGFSNALIREKDSSNEDYSTVFYFNLFTAVILYIALFFTAPFISSFFKIPGLVGILRVLALVIIINSFGLIQRTILTKKLDFKTQTKISVISSVISGVVAILSAFLGFGVWSLVIQTLLMQLIQSVCLSLSNRWVPDFVFSKKSFKRLFNFGWKILVSGLINTLYNNLYSLIIGKAYSAVDLGYYTNAQKLRDVISQSITSAVQKVNYPVLSSIKEDSNMLLHGYKKIIKTTVYITFPLMIGLAVVADAFIRFVFGQKWINSIEYFQILCLVGMMYPLHAINLDMLQVKGRSDLFLRLEIIKKIIGAISIITILYFGLGIRGLLWGLVVVSYISYFINSYYSAELLDYSTKKQIKDIMPAFLSSIIMGVCVYLLGSILPDIVILKIIAQTALAVAIYVFLSVIWKIEGFNTVVDLLKSLLGKIKIKR